MTLPFLYQLQNASFSKLSATDFKIAVVDDDDAGLNASNIQTLTGQGKMLLDYMSIGEAEDYRSYWSSINQSLVLKENPDWPGNYSVKFWDPAWQQLTFARIDQAIAEGYSGIYLDIVDAYTVSQVQKAYSGTQAQLRQEMLDFVEAISAHAKAINPNFLVVPQNAVGLLAMNEDNPDSGPNVKYLNAIDGLGIEDLWYDGNSTSGWTSGDLEYIQLAQDAGKFVLATSYPTDVGKQATFVNNAINAGLIPFAADRDLTGKVASIDSTIDGLLASHHIALPTAHGHSVPAPTIPQPPVSDPLPPPPEVPTSNGGGNGGTPTPPDTSHSGGNSGNSGTPTPQETSSGGGNGNSSNSGNSGTPTPQVTSSGGNNSSSSNDNSHNSHNSHLPKVGHWGNSVANDLGVLLSGNRDDNTIVGQATHDKLVGRGGDDVLRGGDGNDILKGGNGDDELHGGKGDDVLIGGKGKDVFVFENDSGHDTVKNFQRGQDHIDLTALNTGFSALDSNHNGVLDKNDADVKVSHSSTVIDLGHLTGGAAGLDVLTLQGTTGLHASDFFF